MMTRYPGGVQARQTVYESNSAGGRDMHAGVQFLLARYVS